MDEVKLPDPAGIIIVGTQALRAFTAEQLQAAVKAETERCAKIVEDEALNDPNTESDGDAAYDLAIKHCAAAIRAQNEENPPAEAEG